MDKLALSEQFCFCHKAIVLASKNMILNILTGENSAYPDQTTYLALITLVKLKLILFSYMSFIHMVHAINILQFLNVMQMGCRGKYDDLLYPPQTLFVGGILFSRCPSVRLSVRPSVRPCIRPSVRP